jgi:uncharacterized protein YndB with AHSA1/START domain
MTAPAATVDAVQRTVEIIREGPDGQDEPDQVQAPAAGRPLQVRTTLVTQLALAPADLWPMITDPSLLARWYGPVGGDLREGGRFTAAGGTGGRIETVEAPHLLELSWGPEEASGPLVLRLDPTDEGTTELALSHTVTLDPDVFAQYGPGAWALGWDIALLGLAGFSNGWAQDPQMAVPTPTPVWLASPAGAEYVRAWSIRWAAASVAAGTDEDLARRGEAASSAAYGATLQPQG